MKQFIISVISSVGLIGYVCGTEVSVEAETQNKHYAMLIERVVKIEQELGAQKKLITEGQNMKQAMGSCASVSAYIASGIMWGAGGLSRTALGQLIGLIVQKGNDTINQGNRLSWVKKCFQYMDIGSQIVFIGLIAHYFYPSMFPQWYNTIDSWKYFIPKGL